MTELPLSTLEKILAAAKAEFLEKGYQSASLRNIVKSAGVTTGTFYGYYSSKEALFAALVDEPCRFVLHTYRAAVSQFEQLQPQTQVLRTGDAGKDCMQALLLYMDARRDAFHLVLECADGTPYSHAEGEKKRLALSVVLSVLSVMLGLAPFYCMCRLVCLFVDGSATAAGVIRWCLLSLAAYAVGHLIDAQRAGTAFDTSLIWKCIVLQIVLVFLRFLFDYFRARLQEPISYQLTARDRLAIGDALKRVSLGYFQQVSTGSILSSITTGLSTLENMGIRMIDNFVGGYLNFLVIFVCLAVCSPVTALIALAAAAASLLFMLLISHYSRVNAPVEAQANRDLTGAVIEYARGLSVVKSFGQSGASIAAVTQAIDDSRKIHLKIEWG